MKKLLLTAFCIFILLLLSGCWSRKEPKTLAIIESGLYDIEENGNYEITAEILNPAAIGGIKDGGSSKNPFFTVISEGASIPKAIRNLSVSFDKPNFGAHIKARFFTEKFAQQDMPSLMDYLLRENLTDENPFMFVIKDENPKKIYACALGLSDTVGGFMYSMSKSQPTVLSESVFIETLQFIKDYYNEGKEPVIGLIQFAENEPTQNTEGSDGNNQNTSEKKYKIICEGLAAFKDNKLAGYFNGEEARAYNFITNNIKSAIISSKIGEDYTVFKVKDSKADIKTKLENNQITIDVKISIDTSIIQETADIDITKMEPLKMLEETLNKQMEEEISAAVKKAQNEFQSDIFGFGSQFHIQYPKEWKEIKENWNEEFSNATVNITVDSSVNRTGELKQPFIEEN